ncbi:Flavoprotein pyridine nucleotide cytochrome reductase domain-containing protein [Rozella allomycis CSF55]|uniref:NADPH--hemoprotein reductase n=1 Tax=Rozella allomycis (strain CSF55) TaxID=988480 RepID=A0A075ATQ4_ROZAC|nr:Flavoprotein pyridine nucleotide cytochrome reductase domain-containing protein [Rozella allomycis CSF55]|eukprot:EPZ31937.1 Flavoprotein pyridine nucleotide cytochrome reductase domain-containing protein [Rozella allomycis CSF55]
MELQKLADIDYNSKVASVRLPLIEVFRRFASVKIPLISFLSISPIIQPRLYSISSSPSMFPNTAHLTISILQRPEAMYDKNQTFTGFVSNYISNIEENNYIFGFPKPHGSNFHLPEDNETPIIMIGAGTGLAPFRAFLQERHVKLRNGEKLAQALLIFGCRNPNHDELYAEEINEYLSSGALTAKYVAYSRVENNKMYVQDRIKQSDCKDMIWSLFHEQSGKVYVCGDGAGMAKGVIQTFKDIASEFGFDGEEYLRNALKELRYLEDVWA